MNSLGSKLQIAREFQGLTLEQIASTTRVREQYLKALEEDRLIGCLKKSSRKALCDPMPVLSISMRKNACNYLWTVPDRSTKKKKKSGNALFNGLKVSAKARSIETSSSRVRESSCWGCCWGFRVNNPRRRSPPRRAKPPMTSPVLYSKGNRRIQQGRRKRPQTERTPLSLPDSDH